MKLRFDVALIMRQFFGYRRPIVVGRKSRMVGKMFLENTQTRVVFGGRLENISVNRKPIFLSCGWGTLGGRLNSDDIH